MRQIISFLGFIDPASILWNFLAYAGMILIIAGVVSAKFRNHFFIWGPLALLFYAWLYLHNPILAGLQFIIAVSGLLNIFNSKKHISVVMIFLVLAVYLVLLLKGQISGLWPLIGSFGLLCIAFGIAQLPRKRAFELMAIGGILIGVYAFALSIWVWLVLNIIFAIASFLELKKHKAA